MKNKSIKPAHGVNLVIVNIRGGYNKIIDLKIFLSRVNHKKQVTLINSLINGYNIYYNWFMFMYIMLFLLYPHIKST